MPAWLVKRWNDLRASYWFIPSVMTVAAAVLAVVMTGVDERIGAAWLDDVSWLYANKPEGARALLSTVAGSMIGVAGVTFSITIAAVVYASGQYGPRLLTNFMRDTGNQITLGTFIATFLYGLLVLRTIRAADEPAPGSSEGGGLGGHAAELVGAFVPHLSILVALALGLASIGVFIFFIHHAPDSIHVAHVVAGVGRELEDGVGTLFPDHIGHARDGDDGDAGRTDLPARFYQEAAAVTAEGTGYVQSLSADALLAAAERHDLVVKLKYRPGDFVSRGEALVLAWPATRVDRAARAALRAAFAWGRSRTPVQDLRFLVDELVEVAARALSPGVNDPFTAMNCLDWLGAALKALATREMPPSHRYDADGRLRVIAEPTTFAEFAGAVFGQLRPYAAADRNAALHLLRVLGEVAGRTEDAGRRAALRHEADAFLAACERRLDPADLDLLRERMRTVHRLLAGQADYDEVAAEADWLGGSA